MADKKENKVISTEEVELQTPSTLTELLQLFNEGVTILTEESNCEVSDNVKQMAKEMLSMDDSHLKNIQLFLEQIIKDKKVDIKDVPTIMLLTQELYVIYDNIKLTTPTKDIISVFKLLINLFLENEVAKKDSTFTKEEMIVLTLTLHNLLDMCVKMIELKDTQKQLTKISTFFKNLFGCSIFSSSSEKDAPEKLETKEETKEEPKEEIKEEPKDKKDKK